MKYIVYLLTPHLEWEVEANSEEEAIQKCARTPLLHFLDPSEPSEFIAIALDDEE